MCTYAGRTGDLEGLTGSDRQTATRLVVVVEVNEVILPRGSPPPRPNHPLRKLIVPRMRSFTSMGKLFFFILCFPGTNLLRICSWVTRSLAALSPSTHASAPACYLNSVFTTRHFLCRRRRSGGASGLCDLWCVWALASFILFNEWILRGCDHFSSRLALQGTKLQTSDSILAYSLHFIRPAERGCGS